MFNALRAASSRRVSVVKPQAWSVQARLRSDTPSHRAAATASSILTQFDGPPQAGEAGYPPPAPPGQVGGKGNMSVQAVALPRLRLHCHSTPNNTIATLTKEDGSTIAWFSSGSCGFKKGNRATYEAGYQCAVRSFKKIEDYNAEHGPVAVDLFFKGFGQGRDALKAALLATEGETIRSLVASMTDRTPIKIGGTRSKKSPRL